MPNQDSQDNKTMAATTSSASSSGISVNVEKLNGISNYGNWKFLMRMYLIHEDLWDCIEESGPGVPKVTDARKQQRALAKICLMVQPSSFSHVRNVNTGYEAWTNLKNAYEDRGLCRRLGLLRTLFGLKLEQFNDMEAYLLKICDLDQQLRDINSPLDDDFLSVLMLSGLPSDYDPLIMALENSNIKLCSETVKSKLLQENLRRDFDKGSEESALLTSRSAKTVGRNYSKIKCFYCKKTGHFAKNCPTKTAKSEKKCDKSEKAWNGTLLTALAVDINSNAWYVDSGATCHMTNNKNILKNYVEHSPRLVTVANNHKIYSEGHGEVELYMKGCKQSTKLIEVIFVPELSTNLLSVNKITEKGLEVHFDTHECKIYYGKVVVASAMKMNGVYQLDTEADGSELTGAYQTMVSRQPLEEIHSSTDGQQSEAIEIANLCGAEPSQELWHRRLCHLNLRSMGLLKQGMASEIDYSSDKYTPCVACIEGKQSRLPFPKQSYSRADQKLGLIHSDLCGPMSVSSFGGARYLLIFIDDFTRMTFGYFIKTKDEVLSVFKNFKSFVENQTDLKIKKLRTDNGCEYVNKQFQIFLREHGIEHQTTVPYSPQQNGVAERANRTIMEAARCMLQDAGMDKRFWAEAVNTAIYIKNKSPSKAVRGTTPEEKWTDVTWTPNMASDISTSEYEDIEENHNDEIAMKIMNYSDEPLTGQEALSGPESEHWKRAIMDEFESFEKNKAWTLTTLPAGKKSVKCKWIFKKKLGPDGELQHYKARLVAKGFTQKYGEDYKETYSPVVRYSTIRTLLALAVDLDMSVDHMDVKTAFLNGNLQETVYMDQPDGFKVKGKEDHVFKLNKAIYGLKQASKAWYDKIDNALKELQFQKSLSEPCVYIKMDDGNLIILALYVDDILIFSKNSPAKMKLKEALMKMFEMKDLGQATHVLGMRLKQEVNKIILDQKNYIQKVLEQFNMIECKPVNTPLESGMKFEKGVQNIDNLRYRSLMGCIMYIAVCTRPDIAHAASLLSQFNNCHTEVHWKAAKRILRYLKGTMDYCIVYEKTTFSVTGFVDADWASSQLDRRSYTGYIFKIGNAAVSWESRKQKTVALSTTEAEYMALCEGAKEATFLRNFLYECLGKYCSITLYNDSQSAQKLCKSQIHHSRSKHIDIRHHFVRQIVNDKILNLEYMSTENMPADVLTKSLSKDKHFSCITNIGLKTV